MIMLDARKLKELRQRMHRHAVVNDTALVIVTAAELGALLDAMPECIGYHTRQERMDAAMAYAASTPVCFA